MSCKTVKHGVAMATLLWLCMLPSGCGKLNVSYAPPIQYVAENVTDEWVGFSRSGDDIFKLDLRPDKTGTLVWAGRHDVFRYGIVEWRIKASNVLNCTFGNPADAHAPVEMTCVIEENRLVCVLNNGAGGWKIEIIFRRASDLQDQLSRINK